jgi:WD40 repeat-containing protein SMU1
MVLRVCAFLRTSPISSLVVLTVLHGTYDIPTAIYTDETHSIAPCSIHGLRSGKILKEFRGHSGALSSLSYLHDGTNIVTASMDGSVKVWDGRTQVCLHTLTPPQAVAGVECPIVAVLVVPRSADHLLIVPRAGTAYIMTTKGSVLRTLSHGKELPPEVATAGGGKAASERASRVSPYDFIAATVSPQGRWAYLIDEDKTLYAFSVATGKCELAVEGVGSKDILGIAHHPTRNLLATYSADGALRLWKP